MSTPHASSFAKNVASTARPAEGAFRRVLREIWQSYTVHSELRVMLSTGRWTPEAEEAIRSRMPG